MLKSQQTYVINKHNDTINTDKCPQSQDHGTYSHNPPLLALKSKKCANDDNRYE